MTGTDHVVTEFSFGGIPHAEAEKNMRLFASRVLPIVAARRRFRDPGAANNGQPAAAGTKRPLRTGLSARPMTLPTLSSTDSFTR